jgi:ubiquinone/menaquinone biosynthesis C-methylase UbiE
MVRLAREKVRRAGLANVTVKKANAESLPFADASLDAVFAFHLLRHLVKPAAALAEFGRVVRDGGRVVLVELEPHGHRALREATGSTHLGLPRETVRAGLKRAGFADARFSALVPYRVPSEAGETLLPTYLVDAVRNARGEKEPS